MSLVFWPLHALTELAHKRSASDPRDSPPIGSTKLTLPGRLIDGIGDVKGQSAGRETRSRFPCSSLIQIAAGQSGPSATGITREREHSTANPFRDRNTQQRIPGDRISCTGARTSRPFPSELGARAKTQYWIPVGIESYEKQYPSFRWRDPAAAGS